MTDQPYNMPQLNLGLRIVTIPDRNLAMGTAVRLMMTRQAFDQTRFGDWARMLDMQFQRGHYGFVVDETHQVRGYLGWAKTTQEAAEAWSRGEQLTSEQVHEGDCLVINAWIETGPEVHRFMFGHFRSLARGHSFVYAVRAYPDGRKRFMRLPVASLDTAFPVHGDDAGSFALSGDAA